MSRRAVNITLDNLDDLPGRCRKCVFWQLDPVGLERAIDAGDTEFEKESWVSATLLEWGSCGKIVYADGADEQPQAGTTYRPAARAHAGATRGSAGHVWKGNDARRKREGLMLLRG